MSFIHPTAIISPKAELGKDVAVGPYCIIEEGVKIGDGTKLQAHVVVSGDTVIGKACEIFPFAAIGLPPQDFKYEGEVSRTIIGDHTTIRESVTVNRGTKGGIMETRVGDHCLLMACSHVSHDCILGDHVILANAVLLAGHCIIEDHVFLGGAALCLQFIHVGAHALISGGSGLASHVPPYISVFGTPAVFTSLNVIGLKRRGFAASDIQTIRKFYKCFFALEGTAQSRITSLEKDFSGTHTDIIIDFIKNCFETRHSIVQPRR